MPLRLTKDGKIDRRGVGKHHSVASDPQQARRPSPQQVFEAMRLLALDGAIAEKSLIEFIRLMWSILEPQREFVNGWAVEAICEHLTAVSNGEIRKLLMNVPPGFMKSMTTNVFWPAWEWGPRNRPDLRYVSASYSESLTLRDNRRCRQLITSELYQAIWGSRFKLMDDQNAKVRYDTDKTGFKIATSVSGLATGERGDRFIIDDPHNVKEAESEIKREAVLQWFTEVVPTRINDAGKSAIIVIMQRVHERDNSGLILAKELGYTHLCIPMEWEGDHPYPSKTTVFMSVPAPTPEDPAATARVPYKDPREGGPDGVLAWPERFSRDYLESDLKPSLRAWGGSYAEAGQLQQRPSPRGGGMFKKAGWKYVDSLPERVLMRVRGWDLAATDDNPAAARTAGVRMSIDSLKRIYIEDVRVGQWSDKGVEDKMVECGVGDPPGTVIDFPQDPGQAGKAQKSYLSRQLHGHDVHATPETGDKVTRARPLAAQQETGNVYLVRGPWNEDFTKEAESFPMGHWKDQVDAASRAYARLIMRRPEKSGGAGGKCFVPTASEA